ncbi:MAG: hypothetical protein ACXWLO_09155, partial [Rhizomicrobium sp.]
IHANEKPANRSGFFPDGPDSMPESQALERRTGTSRDLSFECHDLEKRHFFRALNGTGRD